MIQARDVIQEKLFVIEKAEAIGLEKGRIKGKLEGKIEGNLEGKIQKEIELILGMHYEGFKIPQMARITHKSEEEIIRIIKESEL
jgi:predicted transposase YdaD